MQPKKTTAAANCQRRAFESGMGNGFCQYLVKPAFRRTDSGAAKPPSVPRSSLRREGLPDNTVRTSLDIRNNSNNRAS